MTHRRSAKPWSLRILGLLALIVFLGLLAWVGGLVWNGFDAPLLALVLVSVLMGLRFIIWKKSPQGWRWPALLGAAGLTLVACYAAIQPSTNRDWIPEVTRQPWAEISGDTITLHNYRNFDWQPDGSATERWETRTFSLSRLKGVDLLLAYWGSPNIAHTMLSFDFGEEVYVAASIETRREVGERYHPLSGMLRKYELLYVLGSEQDVLRLRTHIRKNDLYLFRLTASPEKTRSLFLSYLESANALQETPAWYHSLTTNCTTTIRQHERQLGSEKPWSWRILANGHLPAYLYAHGYIDRTLPLADLIKRSAVSADAQAAPIDDYSTAIRRGRPGF